jgi:hypothetical protein
MSTWFGKEWWLYCWIDWSKLDDLSIHEDTILSKDDQNQSVGIFEHQFNAEGLFGIFQA